MWALRLPARAGPWGADRLWAALRGRSTSAEEEAWRCGAQLLEVLEARMQQLRASAAPDRVMLGRAGLAPPRPDGPQAPAGHFGVGVGAAVFPEESALSESELQLTLEERVSAALARAESTEQGAKKQRKAKAGAHKAAKQSSPAPGEGRADKLEGKEKHRGMQRSIVAYLETCLFLDKPEWAQQCLVFCCQSPKYRKLLCSKMYNILLRGWAKKGSLKHVSSIFFMLYNTGLKPTVESYAMALECMGRVSCAPKKIQQFQIPTSSHPQKCLACLPRQYISVGRAHGWNQHDLGPVPSPLLGCCPY